MLWSASLRPLVGTSLAELNYDCPRLSVREVGACEWLCRSRTVSSQDILLACYDRLTRVVHVMIEYQECARRSLHNRLHGTLTVALEVRLAANIAVVEVCPYSKNAA